jgi:hypothetical protein
MENKSSSPPPENGLLNILFNILLPILILNNLSQKFGALAALGLALSFPLFYGLYDGIKRKKANFFSVLGVINVLLTGSLAVLGLGGTWFAVKEAAFPSLVGLFVLGSAFTQKPFIKTLFVNPQLVNIEVLMTRLQEKKKESEFALLMKQSTIWLSMSFFFSATLNFILARRIFLPLESSLDSDSQSVALNHQIADMTKWAMIMILIPSLLFLFTIFWRLLKKLGALSGLATDEILAIK